MKKRFIAGAVCPQCGETDKTLLYQQAGDEVSECVSCGYKRFKSQMLASTAEPEANTVVRLLNLE